MAEITGTALRYDGLPVDYVSIFNWATGACIAQIKPDPSGNWSYEYEQSLHIGITYVSDGCEPTTHGKYEFIAAWQPLVLQPKLYLDTDSAVWSGGVGSNITAWQDLSGEQSDFLLNGSVTKTADDAVSIPSGNNYLYNNSVKAKSILSGIGKTWVFMVVKPKVSGVTFFMVDDASNRGYTARLAILYERGVFTLLSARNTNSGNNYMDSSVVATNEYYMVLLEHDWQTGRVAWHINGALDTFNDNHIADKGLTSAAQASNKVYIGQYATAGSSSPHDFKSLAVYTDKTLTQAEIDKLFGYAAHKHGLTNKLPASHPYKTETPT